MVGRHAGTATIWSGARGSVSAELLDLGPALAHDLRQRSRL